MINRIFNTLFRKQHSIARKLLLAVFSIYLVIAIIISVVQMVIEYRKAHDDISLSINTIAQTSNNSIGLAMWDMNQVQLESIIRGLVKFPEINGAVLYNGTNNVIYSSGDVSDSFSAQVALYHHPVLYSYRNEQTVIGQLTLSAPANVVLDRVGLGFVLLIISAVIKTLCLWIIFLYFSRTLLQEPLSQITSQIKASTLNHSNTTLPLDKTVYGETELTLLSETFHTMLETILDSQQELQNINDTLKQRTFEMEKARDEAEHANMAKSEFLSSMTHELRTPMTAILGFSQLLELDPKHTLTQEQNESIQYIKDSGEHLLLLINNVLDLAKIESGNLDAKIEKVEVFSLVEEVVNLMKAEAEKSSVILVSNIDKNSTITLKADYKKLKQVLLNFASNGIKYNTENGVVCFSSTITAHGTIRINVSDTGTGVEKESLVAIFKPFIRLGMANSSLSGTGIGLTICKQLVELMNGEIGVLQKPKGKGLTFWVEFDAVNG